MSSAFSQPYAYGWEKVSCVFMRVCVRVWPSPRSHTSAGVNETQASGRGLRLTKTVGKSKRGRRLTFCLLKVLFFSHVHTSNRTTHTHTHTHTPTYCTWTTQTPCCSRHLLVMLMSLLTKTVKAWNRISIKLISKHVHTPIHTHAQASRLFKIITPQTEYE